jgi:hypothetical protein
MLPAKGLAVEYFWLQSCKFTRPSDFCTVNLHSVLTGENYISKYYLIINLTPHFPNLGFAEKKWKSGGAIRGNSFKLSLFCIGPLTLTQPTFFGKNSIPSGTDYPRRVRVRLEKKNRRYWARTMSLSRDIRPRCLRLDHAGHLPRKRGLPMYISRL